MTKEQRYKKEYAYELLRIAEGDLETAEVLFQVSRGRKENICFTAQQVIEKSIKAVLCWLQLSIPLSHNLDILIDRIPANLQVKGFENANELTAYATIRRYEEGKFELDKSDLDAAMKLARLALSWAKKIVGEN